MGFAFVYLCLELNKFKLCNRWYLKVYDGYRSCGNTQKLQGKHTNREIFAILPNALAFLKSLCYAAFSETFICVLFLVNVFYFGWCSCFGLFYVKYGIIPFVHNSVYLLFSNKWRRCLLLSETLGEYLIFSCRIKPQNLSTKKKKTKPNQSNKQIKQNWNQTKQKKQNPQTNKT